MLTLVFLIYRHRFSVISAHLKRTKKRSKRTGQRSKRAAVAARRIAELSERVRYLEEQFRLAQLKRYAPRSEKSRERVFNEAEHEAKADPGTDERTVPLLDTGLPQEAPRS